MSTSSLYPTIRPSLDLDFANSEQLDPRITFSRSTTATYYDDNTVAKAEENLLTYSQEFDNAAWAKQNSAVTANATTSPDGTSTADTLTASATSSNHLAYQLNATVSANTISTHSVFLKANTNTFASISMQGNVAAAWYALTVNLSTGTITQTGAGSGTYISSSITSVGNGWYRVSITGSIPTVLVAAVIQIASTATPTYGSYGQEIWTAAGTESIYIWGAQLEQRSTVTAYTATTTAAITNYIPVLMTAPINDARFDHNPTTRESLGLLIEESRTNLLNYSEQFDDSYWTKTRSSITSNTVVAPNGTQTGDKLVEDTTATAGHLITSTAFTSGLTNATSYTFSVYAKASGRNWIALEMGGNLGGGYGYFDIANGVLGTQVGLSGTSTITSVGNGWYRCTVTDTTTGTGSAASKCNVYLGTADGTLSYTGDGYSGAFVWGAQLELGAFATSYIPTVASAVTRSADSASMTGVNFSSWYQASEGSIYAEVLPYSITVATSPIYNISDGTAYNRITSNADSQIHLYVIKDNVVQASIDAGTFTANQFSKIAACYKTNDFAVTINANAGGSDSAGAIPAVNKFDIGTANNLAFLNGCIKRIAYYPLRLTNANLQAITS